MKLQFYKQNLFYFSEHLILYVNRKNITFINYTDFVVNYDEDHYIPKFFIQLIYNVS